MRAATSINPIVFLGLFLGNANMQHVATLVALFLLMWLFLHRVETDYGS